MVPAPIFPTKERRALANQHEVSDEDLRAALAAELSYSTKTEAARSLRLDRSTFIGRLRLAKRRGLEPKK